MKELHLYFFFIFKKGHETGYECKGTQKKRSKVVVEADDTKYGNINGKIEVVGNGDAEEVEAD